MIPPRRTFVAVACLLAVGCSSSASLPGSTLSPSSSTSTSLAAAPDRFFTEAGVRLRFRDLGRGEPVLLLHGYSGRLEDWAGVADSLARDHRVVILDQRGFGESSKFSEPARYGSAMADDVVRLLDALGIERAHLVGHSLGALVAANVAVRHPGRVSTAALIAGAFYPDSAAAAREVAPWVANLERGEGLRAFGMWLFPGMSDSLAAAASDQALARNDLPSLIAVMRSLGALMVPRGTAVPVPALVAVGTADPLFARSRDLAQWWPDARFLQVGGANHGTVARHPEVLNAIRAIVRSRRAAGS